MLLSFRGCINPVLINEYIKVRETMTAIVGILNKRGAVMAADSAVTVTNGDRTKIYNTATKIFRLSLKHPILPG